MAEVGLGIEVGPGSSVDVRFGLDPRSPDRLIVDGGGGGCLRLLGAGLLVAGLLLEAESLKTGSAVGLVVGAGLAMIGAVLLFSRVRSVLDRSRGRIEVGLRLGVTTPLRTVTTAAFERVVISQDDSVSTDSDGHTTRSTSFAVALVGGDETHAVATAGVWEAAVPVAEALSRFLRLPLDDRAADRVRGPEELDLPLAAQPPGGPPGRGPGRAPGFRVRILRDDEDRLEVEIPLPDGRPALGILVFVLVFWALPVGLLSRDAFTTLLPVAVAGATWVKVAFGYSARVRATAAGLEILTRGLILRRRVEIPAAEIEDLDLRHFEWGGPRSTLAHLFDGFLVARSDRASVRFGHGLVTAELRWLRHRLRAVLSSGSAPATTSGQRRIPTLPSPDLRPVAGAMVGIALAHVVGGPLGLCVRLPFLTHLLSTGAILGLALGHVLSPRSSDRGRWWPLAGAGTALLVLAGLIVQGPGDWLASGPGSAELDMLAHGLRPDGFWLGWLVVGGLAHSVAAAVLLAGVIRAVASVGRRRSRE